MIKLIEVSRKAAFNTGRPSYEMNEVFVNPESIISIREDKHFKSLLLDGLLPWKELRSETEFSTITMNSGGVMNTLTVAGSPKQLQEKCSLAVKKLLKG